MEVFDFTQLLTNNTQVYPGDSKPSFAKERILERDGYAETAIRMNSHTGTHMDAPAHLISQGKELDLFSPEQFVGTAVIVDCTHRGKGEQIRLSDLGSPEQRAMIDEADYVLFWTGWDRYWGTEEYYSHYPVLSEEVVDLICRKEHHGIGMDVMSADSIGQGKLPNHFALLGREMVILENLTRLEEMYQKTKGCPFLLVAAPLRLEHSDGAPCRVFGILDEKKKSANTIR